MKIFSRLAILAVAAGGFAAMFSGAAMALPSVTETVGNGGVVINTASGSNGGAPGFTFTMSVAQFNTNLAGVDAACNTLNICTLASVQVQFFDATTGQLVFTDTGSATATFTGSPSGGYQFGTKANATSILGSSVLSTIAAADACNASTSTTSPIGCDAFNTINLNNTTATTTTATMKGTTTGSFDSGAVTNSSLINPYIGASTFQFTSGNTQSYSSGSTTGTFTTVGTYTETLSANVIYTYNDTPPSNVPEPASIVLLGVGLAGLGLIRRGKATKAG